MSILPLTAASIGVEMFSMPVAVRDVIFDTVTGEDVESLLENRTVKAAVDARDKKVQFLFGRITSNGSIAIFTHDTLFVMDEYPPSTRNQSYITYNGFIYKVTAIKNWQIQAGVRIYLAERHSQQQDL